MVDVTHPIQETMTVRGVSHSGEHAPFAFVAGPSKEAVRPCLQSLPHTGLAPRDGHHRNGLSDRGKGLANRCDHSVSCPMKSTNARNGADINLLEK